MSNDMIERLFDEMEDRLLSIEAKAQRTLLEYERLETEATRLKKFIIENDYDGYWEEYHYPIDNDDLED